MPLHTLRANIDYGFYEARTTFGRIGVKVWIYKGDVTQRKLARGRPLRHARRGARAGRVARAARVAAAERAPTPEGVVTAPARRGPGCRPEVAPAAPATSGQPEPSTVAGAGSEN